MGAEQAGKGANVQLAPGTNVARVPWNGRLFEYISGEVRGGMGCRPPHTR